MNSPHTTKVIVGLSGGVDSSVCAYLLQQQGYQVEGLFMKNWEEEDYETHCSLEQDLADAKAVCNTLEIPLHTVNFSQEYWEKVFSLFLEEYRLGRTPNPDILCNKEIKFKAFLEHAQKLGADLIAMGHYAQKSQSEGSFSLLKGFDRNKDQTYFLYTLTQKALQHSLFPVGGLEKSAVRQIAKQARLNTHHKKDSTGICFIGERKFKTFLQDFLIATPGTMLTPEGKTVGKHSGLLYYTLGQRQGLLIGGRQDALEKPWYVVGKDLKNNNLFVTQDNLHPWHFCDNLTADQMHWIGTNPPQANLSCFAKTRYRQEEQACHVTILGSQQIKVNFTEPQRAVTPGQSIVLYDGERCLGGGIIQQTNSPGGLQHGI